MNQETLTFFEKRIKLIRDKFNLSPIDPKRTIEMEGLMTIITMSQSTTGKGSLFLKAAFSRVHISKMVSKLAETAGIENKESREYSGLFFLNLVLVVMGTDKYTSIISSLGYDASTQDSLSFTKDVNFPKKLAEYLAEEYPQFDEFKTSLESLGMEL